MAPGRHRRPPPRRPARTAPGRHRRPPPRRPHRSGPAPEAGRPDRPPAVDARPICADRPRGGCTLAAARRRRMPDQAHGVVVGLDNGGTTNNTTVLDSAGRFLVDHMLETHSLVQEGPEKAMEALARAFAGVLEVTGTPAASVLAVGLDTPGPASANGVISARGAVNFLHPAWRGFDIRGALEDQLGLPVVYNNDANAAALYAHYMRLGSDAPSRSSVSVIVGTGLGGGVIESGRVVRGAAGMAGELGHVRIPTVGLLAPGQPVPVCNCGLPGDAESFASLTGITKNLLPYWLTRFPGHQLHGAGS